MSYVADFIGEVIFTTVKPEYVQERLEDVLDDISNAEIQAVGGYHTSEDWHSDLLLNTTKCKLSLDGYSSYDEDEFKEFLDFLLPYTLNGKIHFKGEDGALWRYILDGKGNKKTWKYQVGIVTYEDYIC